MSRSGHIALLRANVWLHELRNVAVLPIAEADRAGYAWLEPNEADRGDHRV